MRRTHRITMPLAVALAAGAIAAPAALAQGAPPNLPAPSAAQREAIRHAEQQKARALDYRPPSNATYSDAELLAFVHGTAADHASTVSAADGFDWASALLGAAAAAGLMVVLAAALRGSRRLRAATR